jgi:hypothetical protein
VIALQALRLALSVAVGSSPFFSSLCLAGTSVASSSPADHQTGCPCAAGCGMQCCVHVLAGPPQASAVLDLTRVGVLMRPAAIEAVIRAAVRSPQVARAPPAA